MAAVRQDHVGAMVGEGHVGLELGRTMSSFRWGWLYWEGVGEGHVELGFRSGYVGLSLVEGRGADPPWSSVALPGVGSAVPRRDNV